MQRRGFKQLLSGAESNAKLAKSDAAARGYVSIGLSLAPHSLSGFNVCSSSTPECRQHCIYGAGKGAWDDVQAARIARTRYFFERREAFRMELMTDIYKALDLVSGQGKRLAMRLNVFSDLPWERIYPELFTTFAEVQFYDYTKHLDRVELPSNYHLTYSRSEANEDGVRAHLAAGRNVAVVFAKDSRPRRWHGVRVIDGDRHDLRFLDPRGVVVGLTAKGRQRDTQSAFFVRR